jgi:hypothetical protein
MAKEILAARTENGAETRFLLEVTQEGERWASTLARLDPEGRPEPVAIAPRFYGLTAEQARRRMITVLENDYDEVLPLGPAAEPAR